MRTLFIFLLCTALVGCASSLEVRKTNKDSLTGLGIGMKKQKALEIMGTKTIWVCPPPPWTLETAGASLADCHNIDNPYRTEVVQGNDRTYEVLYYFTDDNGSEGITDDELTPLVFHKGFLMGWGWAYLNENIKQ
ncbi:DUF3192 domain-containing protein [Candidatus Omnitrophota bacterium]